MIAVQSVAALAHTASYRSAVSDPFPWAVARRELVLTLLYRILM